MKVIDLPRKDEEGRSRFSYSQYASWKRKKKDYVRRYFFEESFDGNAYTEFGRRVGNALENDDYTGFSPDEVETLKKVTRLDQFEREIILDFGNFYLIGYIDTNDVKKKGKKEVVENVVDYKTGALNKVGAYEEEEYNQVGIYAAALKQELGVLPKKGWVELIERYGNPFKGQELTVGKEVVKIYQDISQESVDKTLEDIKKVVSDISAHYKVFKQLNTLIVNPS